MPGDLIAGAAIIASLTDEQAKAVQSVSEFGTTVVKEGSSLAKSAGRILGTISEDAVGLVIGDPLHFVRTAIASQYDILLDKILKRRNVTEPQPVSPSLAIPLMRGAYDENRPELQDLWAHLIAAAMDPKRSSRVRISFTDTLKQFDPLDALVLKKRDELGASSGNENILANTAELLKVEHDEVLISVQNLLRLNCISEQGHFSQFNLTPYGSALLRACSD
jgi:Abortive infection alpha